ncbi:MAG TPA: ATP-grasp domain-containing protein [Terriglobales bacterium]|nr:ATP-grasp domain-containing protein [Terriglobales bacterium]
MVNAKLKIAVLYDVWGEEVPTPEVVEPKTAGKKKKAHRKTRREKEDREEIFEALEKLGHEPFYQVLDGNLQCLSSLAKCGADLVFNLTEAFAGDDTKEMNVAAYMDLLGIRYTGGGPHAHFLAQDKATAKKMFAFHGIKTPFFATAYRGRIEHAHDVSFPLIVKPVWEDGSIGIDAQSVVNSVKELMERVEYIQNEFDSPALIEEYIDGREIYVAILGSYENAQALPLVELDLSRLPEGTPKIASYDVKFEKETQAHKLTKSHLVSDLEEEMITKLQATGLAAYHAVKLRDYGRVDMRLTPKGEVYVIEANPNPWLSSKQEFAMAAKASGRSYTDLIGEIVEMAITRYTAEGL